MSLSRLNCLLMHDILPFNFGMDYDAWVRLYESESLRELCGSDPATWSQEVRDETNRIAREENGLIDRLMSLSDAKFYAEVNRLSSRREGLRAGK